jgi:hypothetical protein
MAGDPVCVSSVEVFAVAANLSQEAKMLLNSILL